MGSHIIVIVTQLSHFVLVTQWQVTESHSTLSALLQLEATSASPLTQTAMKGVSGTEMIVKYRPDRVKVGELLPFQCCTLKGI